MRTTPLSRRSWSGVERKICSPVSENWYKPGAHLTAYAASCYSLYRHEFGSARQQAQGLEKAKDSLF